MIMARTSSPDCCGSMLLRGRFGLIDPDHNEAAPAAVPTDLRHIRLDQEDPPAAAFFEVLRQGRIGNGRAIKAGTFVLDADLDLIGADAGFNANFLSRIKTVAVLERIDQSLFQSQVDGKEIGSRVPAPFDKIQNLSLHF